MEHGSVTGLTIASLLPLDYEITIVGKHLPGDEPNKDWASPWAAAIWVGVHDSNERDQRMQLDAYNVLWRLAETNPESSVRKAEVTEIMDIGSPSQVWYQNKVHGFRFMSKSELPPKSLFGMKYMTLTITPDVFIEWMRARLEKRGVKFERLHVNSLSDLRGMGHDILINASGLGSATLEDVQDKDIMTTNLQSMLIKKPDYKDLFIRRGSNYYSTAFSRRNGDVYVGGGIAYGSSDRTAYDSTRQMVST